MGRGTRGPLDAAQAFWDASALVPLCVQQSVTPTVETLYKTYDVVVWWATPVEIASALSRLARTGYLDIAGAAESRRLADELSRKWRVVQPHDAMLSIATGLLTRYELRTGDALQLAAALQWCESDPQGSPFVTADQRLKHAAAQTGFRLMI